MNVVEFSQQQRRHIENGIHIGYVASSSNKFAIDSPNSTVKAALEKCPRPGLYADLGIVVWDLLGIPRDKQFLHALPHKNYGTLKHGTWTGIVKELMDNEYDTTFPNFTPVEERLSAIDVSYPVLKTHVAYTTRRPLDSHIPHINVLTTRTVEFWILFCVVGILLASIICIIQQPSPRSFLSSKIFKQFIFTCLNTVLLFTGQPTVRLKHKSKVKGSTTLVKLTFALWGISAFIVGGLYAGTTLVKIVKFRVPMPFHDTATLAKCVQKKECQIMTTSKSSNYQRLTRGLQLSGDEILLHKAVQRNPVASTSKRRVYHDIFATSSRLFNVIFASKVTAESLRASDKKHSMDQYYIVDSSFPDPWCFPTKKNSSLTAFLSKAAFLARERGFMLSTYMKYLPSYQDQRVPSKQLTEPLTIGMLNGTLLTWCCGLVIGTILFTFEQLWGQVRSRNTKQMKVSNNSAQGHSLSNSGIASMGEMIAMKLVQNGQQDTLYKIYELTMRNRRFTVMKTLSLEDKNSTALDY